MTHWFGDPRVFHRTPDDVTGTGTSGVPSGPVSSSAPSTATLQDSDAPASSTLARVAASQAEQLPPLEIPNHWRSGIAIGRHPLELWIVIALLALPGAYVTIEGLDALSAAFDLFDFSTRLGLIIMLLALIVISVGAAFLGIAWMLFVRSRVGRGLAYVVAGVTLLAFVTAQADGAGASAYRLEWLVALASVIALVLLGLAPAVREVFTGSGAPAADEATSVVIARVCVAAAIWANGVLGLAFLLLGPEDSSYYAYGLLEIGVAVVLLHVFKRLRGPDRQARLIASVAAAVAIIATLLGPGIDGFAFGVAVPLVVLVCLWITPDARRWFGDKPIEVTRTP